VFIYSQNVWGNQMSKEPGWVEENILAEALGWSPRKDFKRSKDPDHLWSQFYRFDERVWLNPRMRWTRAMYKDGQYVKQKFYKTLKDALEGNDNLEE